MKGRRKSEEESEAYREVKQSREARNKFLDRIQMVSDENPLRREYRDLAAIADRQLKVASLEWFRIVIEDEKRKRQRLVRLREIGITERQLLLGRARIQGISRKGIAIQEGLSETTVKRELGSLARILGVAPGDVESLHVVLSERQLVDLQFLSMPVATTLQRDLEVATADYRTIANTNKLSDAPLKLDKSEALLDMAEFTLTNRQREILETMLDLGTTKYATVAGHLGITPENVSMHMKNVFDYTENFIKDSQITIGLILRIYSQHGNIFISEKRKKSLDRLLEREQIDFFTDEMLQVIRGWVLKKSNKDLADEIGISVAGVRSRKVRIRQAIANQLGVDRGEVRQRRVLGYLRIVLSKLEKE